MQQAEADAYGPVSAMRARAKVVLVVALLACLTCGFLYVRGLVGPLRRVMDGMRRIVDGDFSHQLPSGSGDEIGALARAFNGMGRMLSKYKREIEAWNRELQERVDNLTSDLFKARLENHTNQLDSTAKLRSLRRDIARAKTIQRERAKGGEA